MRYRIYTIALAFIACIAATTSAQTDFVAPEDEAPAALLSTSLGSADVSLFLAGFWESELSGSIGLVHDGSDQGLRLAPFPGMIQGYSFRQTPDLTIYLLIDDRFSFEASFLDGYELNRFVLGYDGKEGEPLQSVRIGNSDVEIGEYPFIPYGSTPKDAIGIASRLTLGSSEHEIAIRYQPSGVVRRSFAGANELSVGTMDPDDYVRGRYFVLPDDMIDEIEVLIETDPASSTAALVDSNGRHYEELDSGAYVASLSDGKVEFAQPLDRTILISYSKGGFRVGDPNLGAAFLHGESAGTLDTTVEPVDFDFSSTPYLGRPLETFEVDLDGTAYLILFEPGRFSPFEHLGYYRAPLELPTERWRTSVFLSDGSALEAVIDPPESLIRLGTPFPSRHPAERYPLAQFSPGIYGPERVRDPAERRHRIEVEVLTGYEMILLENPVAGSVRLTRNGEPETRFDVDQSGVLTFGFTPIPTDRIEVVHQSPSHSAVGGDLAVAYGSRIELSDFTRLRFGVATFWNIAGVSYSESPNDHPGSLLVSSSVIHEKDGFTFRARAAASVSSADTSGVFRVAGMGGGSLSVPVTESSIFPAPAPTAAPGATPLSTLNRGTLLYKDYFGDGPGGSTVLNSYDFPDLPVESISTYEPGGVVGPYLAFSLDDAFIGTKAVLEYELTDSKVWAGAIIRILGAGESDLSGYNELHFSWLAAEPMGEVIHIQIGAIGEDTDGDGVLDYESSDLSNGYAFNDSSLGGSLRAGTRIVDGNGTRDSEDGNDNGLLDVEQPGRIFTTSYVPGDAEYPASSWQSVAIPLSSFDRSLVSHTRSIRILIENTLSTDVGGRLIFGDIRFTGARIEPDAGDELELSVRSITGGSVEALLDETYPELSRRFHAGESDNDVLKISYSSSASERVLVSRSRVAAITPALYQSLVFYAFGNGATVSVSVVNDLEEGIGLSATLPEDGIWHRIEYAHEDGGVTIDGTSTPGAAGFFDADATDCEYLVLGISAPTAGTLYLDEVHLSESALHAGAGADISARLHIPGEILHVGQQTLLRDLEIDQYVAGGTAQFAPFVSSTGGAYVRSRTEVRGTVGFIAAGVFADVSSQELTDFDAGYRLTIPASPFPVSLSDHYSLSNILQGGSISRSNSIQFRLAPIGYVSIDGTVIADEEVDQRWEIATSIVAGPFSASVSINATEHSREASAPASSFGEQFLDSYRLLIPVGGESERAASGDAELRIGNNEIAIAFRPAIAMSSFVDIERLIRLEGGLNLSIPVRISGPAGIRAVLSLDRPFGMTYTRDALDQSILAKTWTLAGETAAAIATLRDDAYLLSIPILDLAQSDYVDLVNSATAEAIEAFNSSAIQFEMTRPLSSGVLNLLVPGSIETEARRSIDRNHDSTSESFDATGSVRWNSVNLFGALGTSPTFLFYDSDEYSYAVSGDHHVQFGPNDSVTSVGISIAAAFFRGDRTFSVSSETMLGIAPMSLVANSVEAAFIVRQPVEEGLSVPFLNDLFIPEVHFIHTETLDAEVTGGDSGVLVRLTHESILHLADIGLVTARISVGVDTRRSATDIALRTWRWGAEGTVLVRITL